MSEAPAEQLGSPQGPGWWRIHAWPIIGMLAILVSGMAFSFWWDVVIHHVQLWATPPDLWGTFRDAHYIIWSGEGDVYNASTSFVTFPGIAVLLAPIAEIQRAFNLSESYPVYLMKPIAWYVLGPVDMLCGGILLFPLDALARRLSVTYRRRGLLMLAEAALIWPAVAMWGHPEDTIALAFGFYGLIAAHDRRWVHAAGFMALAVAFQPLVLLILPIFLAYVPWKKWPAFAGIAALPSALLLLPPLIQEWGPTTYAILKQPNFPALNHATPWLYFAPVLQHRGHGYISKFYLQTLSNGHTTFAYGPVKVLAGEVVAAGPGRTIALVLACVIGVWVARRKPSFVEVVWWAALALSLRCVFESVIDPYYLLPGLALAVLVSSTLGKTRYGLTVLSTALCVWVSYRHVGPWSYYAPLMLSIIGSLVFSWPGRSQRNDSPVERELAPAL